MDNNNTNHDREKAKQELQSAVKGTHEVLIEATTVFPLTLFPDTVYVDREKITVTQRLFFKLSEVVSIRLEDVLSITADAGPFLGSLKISTRFFDPKKPYSVNYLWRHDALKIKRIVQGYIVALQKNIDCSTLPVPELRNILDKLGQAAPGEEV